MFISCYFGIGTLLSISYDECRRTKKGRPRGGSVTKNLKILLARRASKEALRRGSIAEKTDFYGSGENILGSCPFLQNQFFKKRAISEKMPFTIKMETGSGRISQKIVYF